MTNINKPFPLSPPFPYTGLGNAFLSHISACDAIFHLCRKSLFWSRFSFLDPICFGLLLGSNSLFEDFSSWYSDRSVWVHRNEQLGNLGILRRSKRATHTCQQSSTIAPSGVLIPRVFRTIIMLCTTKFVVHSLERSLRTQSTATHSGKALRIGKWEL